MNSELINKLQYSYEEGPESYPLPLPLKECLQIISNFFRNSSNHKLCLVFPSKELAGQWLTIPIVLDLIKNDFFLYKDSILQSYNDYKKGEKLILNNRSIVEWVGASSEGVTFKTKGTRDASGASITIKYSDVIMLQKAPPSRNSLSSLNTVKETLPRKNLSPFDKLLNIDSFGNKQFQKNTVCLVGKIRLFTESIEGIHLNGYKIPEYSIPGTIDDNGEVEPDGSKLLRTTNLSNLALYLSQENNLTKIIIDGFSSIQERGIDFNDIDVKKIPSILITDLSEVESFENIGNYGFDFFNFSKSHLQIADIKQYSPFNIFDEKLKKYSAFVLKKEVCCNQELEQIMQLILSIEKDDSNKELITIKIALIHISNLISRIAHPLTQKEIIQFKSKLTAIEFLLSDTRFYLGNSVKAIEESIMLLNSVIDKLRLEHTEKCVKLNNLISKCRYDYVICITEDEAQALNSYLKASSIYPKPIVLSVANVNNDLFESRPMKAILTGWAKSNNINRILSSFLFSELTVLFYQFEIKYLDSLHARNRKFTRNVKSTITKKGIRAEDTTERESGFEELFKNEAISETISADNFDITDFEMNLDSAEFSRYIVKGNQLDSIKAKRVEFKNDKFIYLTDTHGLLVLENFQQTTKKRPLHIHKSRIENLHQGDVIAFLKTERELLNKIVAKQTTSNDLAKTTKWIDLWKHLLRGHYKILNGDFTKLIKNLHESGCNRDPVTIRSWLFDDLRIGPRKDDDLIAIAIMANGTELSDNIKEVRNAIRQMTSWRMKASDFVIEQLKSKIKSRHSSIQINTVIDFEDLGEVEILEITEIKLSHDSVDIKNANRLLEKSNL